MSETFEFIGFACLSAFAWFIWPPAALIPAAIFFILAGMALDGVSLRSVFMRKRVDNELD